MSNLQDHLTEQDALTSLCESGKCGHQECLVREKIEGIVWRPSRGGWASDTQAGRYFIIERKGRTLVFGPTPMMPPIIVTDSVDRAMELAEKEIARASPPRPIARDGDEEPCEVCGCWPCAHTDPNTWTWS